MMPYKIGMGEAKLNHTLFGDGALVIDEGSGIHHGQHQSHKNINTSNFYTDS